MGVFERFLTVWVALGIAAGVVLGLLMPSAFEWVAGMEYAQVNLVVAIFIWVMIYPMMIQIDWAAVKDVRKKPQGLMLTLVINWLLKPFTMAALGCDSRYHGPLGLAHGFGVACDGGFSAVCLDFDGRGDSAVPVGADHQLGAVSHHVLAGRERAAADFWHLHGAAARHHDLGAHLGADCQCLGY